jgi:hypothetical protein
VPVLQTKMFDMGSDGTRFTLIVPPKNLAYAGLNDSKGTSPNWYENLRPGPFFDAMFIPGLDNNDLYSVITGTVTMQDNTSKRLIAEPEYILNIVRRKPDSQELYPVRVIHFHRSDLMPYEEDLYDDKGNPETQVLYANFRDFNGTRYPGNITLKRPQEDYQVSMTVDQLVYNAPLTADMFKVEIPEGYKTNDLK